MSIISSVVGAQIGINLVNGKIKPKKKGIGTYISLGIFGLIMIGGAILCLIGLVNANIEYIAIGLLGSLSCGYILLISPYTQSDNNYYIKAENPNSFIGFELYYKGKKIDLKYSVDNEGKFKWGNNNVKTDCVSFADNSKMSKITKFKIVNYFSTWLLQQDYLSKDVTVTFE